MKIEQFPHSNGLFNGIFKNIDRNLRKSKIKINVSGSHPERDPYNIFHFEGNMSLWSSNPDSNNENWIEIELTDRFFDLSGYAIDSQINYPRQWEMYVSIDGSKWTLIDSPPENDLLSDSKGHIFTIKKRLGYARFLKIINRITNTIYESTSLYIQLLEIYGSIVYCEENCIFPRIFLTKFSTIQFTYSIPLIFFVLGSGQ